MKGFNKMDKYEEILEEKIENATKEHDCSYDADERYALRLEIDTYQDALTTYRNLKAKGKI